MREGCPLKGCRGEKGAVKVGHYYRSSDRHWLQRYKCLECGKTYSSATRSITRNQKKRSLNAPIYRLLVSSCSQRRIAKLLKTNVKTVARKLDFLARVCKEENAMYVKDLLKEEIQFDEMETFEHSKLKPLSIAVAVEKGSRKILGFSVSEMPAKGLLAKKSRKKYGKRKDERREGMSSLLREIKREGIVGIESDENPWYGRLVRDLFRGINYKQHKGRRGCVVGQGELKAGGWDPLFSLNHTCAMVRANVNRLVRRTWCTTKRRENLAKHLEIYMHYHNFELTEYE